MKEIATSRVSPEEWLEGVKVPLLIGGLELDGESLYGLSPGEWVDAAVMDAYFSLLGVAWVSASEDRVGRIEGMTLCPACLDDHWSLLILDGDEKTVQHMNSEFVSCGYAERVMRKYLPAPMRTWKKETVCTEQSCNHDDCGIYVAYYARRLVKGGGELACSRAPEYRRHMLKELVAGKLLKWSQ